MGNRPIKLRCIALYRRSRGRHDMSREEIAEELTIEQRFNSARADLEYWQGQYEQWHGVDDLIAAAQQWGIMCGLAAAAPELKPQLDAIDARLYPSDYPEAEAVPF